MRNGIFVKNLLGKDHFEDQRGNGKITLTYVLGTDDVRWV
jgi:hypothetical protein